MAGRSAGFLVISVALHGVAAAGMAWLAVPAKVSAKDPVVAVELVEVVASAAPVAEEKPEVAAAPPAVARGPRAARRKVAAGAPIASPDPAGDVEVAMGEQVAAPETEAEAEAEAETGGGAETPVTATGGEGGTRPGIDRESVRAAVQKQVVYPALARRRGLEGTVILRVRIGAGGSIVETQIERSAGSALDAAAREAVVRAAPLPTPGQGWVRIPVAYKLNAP